MIVQFYIFPKQTMVSNYNFIFTIQRAPIIEKTLLTDFDFSSNTLNYKIFLPIRTFTDRDFPRKMVIEKNLNYGFIIIYFTQNPSPSFIKLML